MEPLRVFATQEEAWGEACIMDGWSVDVLPLNAVNIYHMWPSNEGFVICCNGSLFLRIDDSVA